MDLQDIGFYTLSDDRARNAGISSPLWRCELLITSQCNFKCPYCRGTDMSADITFEHAKKIVDIWASQGLKNIRFSGGEPTIVPWLPELVTYVGSKSSIERIAISTNGTESLKYYQDLVRRGVRDFSISLDACCASYADIMSGKTGYFDTVSENIKELSKMTYVTAGCVFDKNNVNMFLKTLEYAEALGVSDIRIVSSAQYNEMLTAIKKIPDNLRGKFPILNYRVNNYLEGRNVRGLKSSDNNRCPLMLDDMAVKGDKHYPCIIKMREGCAPIGLVNTHMRSERLAYYMHFDTQRDDICKNNCLDICVDYNNKFRELNDA